MCSSGGHDIDERERMFFCKFLAESHILMWYMLSFVIFKLLFIFTQVRLTKTRRRAHYLYGDGVLKLLWSYSICCHTLLCFSVFLFFAYAVLALAWSGNTYEVLLWVTRVGPFRRSQRTVERAWWMWHHCGIVCHDDETLFEKSRQEKDHNSEPWSVSLCTFFTEGQKEIEICECPFFLEITFPI